jgi:membrane protease YdiL (CAAX protease family)
MDSKPAGNHRLQIIVGLCLFLGLPFCHLGDLGKKFSGLGPLFGGEVPWWILFVAILLYVVLLERRRLSSIGFRRPGIADLALALLAAFVLFMGVGLIYQLLLPALHINIDRQLGTVIATPLWFRLITVTRAAVVEETAFRGYGLERLRELTGSKSLAAVVTWFLFTIVHLTSWGWGQVIIAAFGGLILTLLYVWRGNLWANIVAHWLTDGSAFILLPLLMKHR